MFAALRTLATYFLMADYIEFGLSTLCDWLAMFIFGRSELRRTLTYGVNL